MKVNVVLPNELDCILDYRGFYDDCGVCSGGATNHTANSDRGHQKVALPKLPSKN